MNIDEGSGMGFKEIVPTESLKGHWLMEIYAGDIEYDADGNITNELVDVLEGENLIVTLGKQTVLDRLFGLSGVAALSRIGVGTSATPAAIGDTALTGGVFKVFDGTPPRAGLKVTATTTFGTTEANINWQEMGMDNGSTLFNRLAPIGPFNKTSAVSIIVTVEVTQA